MLPAREPRKRLRRRVWLALKIVVGSTVAVGLAGAVVLYLDLAVTRRLVAQIANRVMRPVFRGRMTIETVGRLGLDGFHGLRLRIDEPGGQMVLTADGVHARVRGVELLRAILDRSATLEIDIPEASLDHADLRIDTDEAGTTLLQHALTPVADERAATPDAPPSRLVRLVIAHATAHHVWLHGQPKWAPALDLEVTDAEGKVVVQSTGSVEIDVRRGRLLARALPVAGTGAGTIHGRVLVPSEHGNPVGVTASFEGDLGGIEERARISIDGQVIGVTVDLAEVAPEKVRSVLPEYPVQDLLTAHIDAHGSFPELDVEARAGLRGGGELVTSGQVSLAASQHASFHATLAAIDLRGLAPGMPVSNLAAEIDATLALDENQSVTGAATLVSEGGTIGTQVLPHLDVKATFASGVRGPRVDGRVDATVTVRDPGLTGIVGLHLYPRGKSFDLAFDGNAGAPRLSGAPRLHVTAGGSVAASARGVLALDTFGLAADVDLRGRALAEGPARVASVTATGHVAGTIFAPRIDAKVHATALDVSGAHADQADLTLTGLARQPHVHATLVGGNVPDLAVDADVLFGATTILNDVRATLSRAADRAELRADAVRITAEGATAERIAIDGLGGPVHADLRFSPRAVEVHARGDGVDVGKAARLAGVGAWVSGGTLAFDVGGAVRGSKADGHATVDLTNASILRMHGASVHGEFTLADRRLAGSARADLGDLGTMEVVASRLQLEKAGASSLRSWERAWGSLEVDAKIDMARLEDLLPEGSLPFRVTRGHLELASKLQRDSADDDTPHLAVSARTSQLAVEAREGGAKDEHGTDASARAGRSAPRWRLDGVDVGLDGRIDGESGFAELAARVFDSTGPLVSIDAKSSAMPYTALLSTPRRARELLTGVTFDATVVAPRRKLSSFPAALDLGGTEGELTFEVALRGKLEAPEVDVKARLSQTLVSAARVAFPVDFELTSHYAAGQADARLLASTTRRGQVMEAEAHAQGELFDVLARPKEAAWEASVRAHLAAFPLGGLGFLEDRQVRGHVTGDFAIEGLHRNAAAALDLDADDLQIGELDYRGAHVHAAVDGHRLDATLHLDHGDGTADAHALSAASWGSAMFPDVDPPVDVSLAAKQFRVETFLPFVHDWLAELEGRIDGRAHVAYDPHESKTELEGRFAYSHGKFELSSALGEFHDVSATLVLTPDGVVRLENAAASGVTGKVQAAASARLESGKDGLVLGSARARFDIPKKSPIPVTLEGSPLGTIDGSVDITETPSADRRGMTVAIDVPTMHVQLPSSGSRNLQPLGELGDAEVGVRAAGSDGKTTELVRVPLGPAREQKTRAANARRIDITTHLGSDVEVKRGTQLKVALDGQPIVTVSDRLHVSGQIRLRKGGVLDVQGKSFEIESGTISFVGEDPENPQVVVTAGWNAPDGTRIFADYVGPLKTGKVTLRSEPPLPQTDIVALLVFGSVESGANGAGQNASNSTTNTAVGAAGGVATQPINHALDQFGVHAVAARVDTSQAANPKPEVELQIAKNISVQLAVVIGTPPPGANPDTTLLTLNWRFLRGLSVATTVGNLGSSMVDMVWERRY
jgi:translocation and assembly module TamB